MPAPTGATIEIIERTTGKYAPDTVIIPDTVLINGQKFLTSGTHPVLVENQPNDIVCVTLTLIAHRVEFKMEQVAE